MLNKNLFNIDNEKENQVERAFYTLLNLDKENNRIFKVNNFENSIAESKYIFNREDIVNISSVISREEEKNVYILLENFNEDLKNIYSTLENSFLKLFSSLFTAIPKFFNKENKNLNVNILNLSDSILTIKDENENNSNLALLKTVNKRYIENEHDISLLRNLKGLNIFIPADANQAEYLLKISEKNFYKNIANGFSYFRLSSSLSPKIYKDDYFEEEDLLKEFSPLPDLVYVSKNLDAPFSVGIIASGPILYNALLAAKELEDMNYRVSVLNVSLLQANNEYTNQKIKINLATFANNYKNILTVEEHSKNEGLGSVVAEAILENRSDKIIKLEKLGIEDNLSPRNIISKAEEISGL